jgi:predicted MFS family arabinose efflux permease
LPLGEFVPPASQTTYIMSTYALGVLGNTLFLCNAIPFLTLISPPQLRNHVFSTQVALWPLAGFAGSLCGGLLPRLFSSLLDLPDSHPAPYRYPLLLSAAVLLVSAAAIAATRPQKVKKAQRTHRQQSPFPFAVILVLGITTLLQMAAENSIRIFFNVYMDDGLGASTTMIGGLTAAGQLLAAFTALAGPALSQRFGRVPVITFGAAAMALCLIPLAMVGHWAMAGATSMALIALSSIRRSVYIVFQQEMVAERWRVTMSSALTMAYGISIAGISLGGGWLIETSGYPALFGGSTLITLLGVLCFHIYFRTPRGQYANSPPE